MLPPFPYPSDESSCCYNSSCTDSIDGTGYFIRMFENFNGVSAVMFFLSTLWISVIRGDFCYFSLRCRKGFQIGRKSKPFFYFGSSSIVFLFPCFAVPWRYVEQSWIVIGENMYRSAIFGRRTGMFAETALFTVGFWTSVFRPMFGSLISIFVHT